MYCIRKFADCWAVFNLDTGQNRKLTENEVTALRIEVPELDDPKTAAYYADRVDCIGDKP